MIVPRLPTKSWFGAVVAEALSVRVLALAGRREVILCDGVMRQLTADLLAMEFDFQPPIGVPASVPQRGTACLRATPVSPA